MSISYTRHNKGSEKCHEVKLWGGGGARGAYLAHGLYTPIWNHVWLVPTSRLTLSDLERLKLKCWKLSKIDTCMPLHGEALCESKPRIPIFLICSKEFFYINLQITAICYTSYSCQAEPQGPWTACFIHVCKLNSSAGDWPALSWESKCRGGGGGGLI